jgi:hypothetical protein
MTNLKELLPQGYQPIILEISQISRKNSTILMATTNQKQFDCRNNEGTTRKRILSGFNSNSSKDSKLFF